MHEWEGYHDVFPADWPAAILPDPAGGKASPPSHSTSESGRWDVVQNGHSTITAGSGKSLLEVYVNLCEDDDFKPGKYDPNALIQDRISRATEGPMADKLRKLVGEWDLSDAAMADGNWEAKSDEMGLFATLLACATSRKGYDRRVDFFLVGRWCTSETIADAKCRCTLLHLPSFYLPFYLICLHRIDVFSLRLTVWRCSSFPSREGGRGSTSSI